MSINEELEKRAAAAVAFILVARAVRRDLGGTRIRDYDLLFDDRRDEPLEVTRFADQVVMNTWARLERVDREAPSLARDWTVDVPSKISDASSDEELVYDVNRFFREAESALGALETAGAASDQAVIVSLHASVTGGLPLPAAGEPVVLTVRVGNATSCTFLRQYSTFSLRRRSGRAGSRRMRGASMR